MQVAPDQRPGGRARAADELVEQLDCEQDENGAPGAAEETVLRAAASHEDPDSKRRRGKDRHAIGTRNP
jgi:hypothetical protein